MPAPPAVASLLALALLQPVLTAQDLGASHRILQTGFESFALGPFVELRDNHARWSAPTGHAEIHTDNVRTGKRSLRILGGLQHRVALHLQAPSEVHELSFWAERWTRRAPFQIHIERRRDGDWKEIWTGGDEIALGDFHTRVRVPVEEPDVDAFRIVCTAPDGGGLLLDDLEVARPMPMRVGAVHTEHRVTPVLIGNRYNPLLRIHVDTVGNVDPLAVRGLHLTTEGTTALADIERLEVFYTPTGKILDHRDSRHLPAGTIPFGRAQEPAAKLHFRGDQELDAGPGVFLISATLRADADLDHRVAASCVAVELAGGRSLRPEPVAETSAKRIGLSLRNAGDDGAAVYRIPGLATTPRGTLLAVYDLRWQGWGDLPGDIDVGMSRSTDGGRTWEPMRIVLDQGNDEQHAGDGVGDPCILVDREANTIWVAALWSHGERGWHGSGPGLTPDETGQLLLTKSDDDGRTWSPPVSITPQVKAPEWRLLLQAPGKGIAMRDGTLVFPAQYRDAQGLPHATIVCSRDGGDSWEIGTGAKPDTTECQVVELQDGVLMLNMRDNRGGSRSVCVTRDLGRTWSEHPSSRGALPEPVCMASLIRRDERGPPDPAHTLLFSNPAVAQGPRRAMTVKVSEDGGRTWPQRMHTLFDAGPSAGYSCLTMIDEDTVGLLYEGSLAHLTFLRLPLRELLETEVRRR